MADLIDRQAAIDVLEERLQANGYSNVALVSELNRSIGYLTRLPSAENTSSWEYIGLEEQVLQRTVIGGLALLLRYRCKNCGYLSFSETNYCPECGAKMEE